MFTLLQISPFPIFLCPPPSYPHCPFPQTSPHCCLCLWVTHTCSLANPFTVFHPVPSPLPSGSCQSVPRIHASFYLVHQFFVHWNGRRVTERHFQCVTTTPMFWYSISESGLQNRKNYKNGKQFAVLQGKFYSFCIFYLINPPHNPVRWIWFECFTHQGKGSQSSKWLN